MASRHRRGPAARGVAGLASALASALIVGCAATPTLLPEGAELDTEELLIVDCLLPGQVRRLGTRLTYLSPRRPIKTTASVCEIRGGEYVAYDRANFATALKIWLPQAEEGDPLAQTYVGEIYEKGLGATADYELAAVWYRRAAEQGESRANLNLGYLYETGLGVERDLTEAMNLYRQASGLVDGDLEYVSSIEYADREAAKVESVRLQEQVGELQTALDDATARLVARQSTVERERAEIEGLRSEVEAERQRVLAAAESEAPTEVRADAVVGDAGEVDAEAASARAETAEREAGEIAARAEAAERAAAEATVRADAAAVDNARLTAKLDAAAGAIAERERELAELNEQLAETRASDDISRERRAALESRLATAGDELEQARGEQTRLTGRLRDVETEALRRERGDAAIIAALDATLSDRERDIARQSTRIGSLEEAVATSEARLAAAPDRAERDLLRRRVVEQRDTLAAARAEQTRLTERLADQQLGARRQKVDSDSRLAELERTLAEREAAFVEQREALVRLEEEVAGTRVQLTARDADQIASVVTTGPSIDIIDPPMLLTRGTPTLAAAERPALELIGRVDPVDSLLAFKINGATQPVSTAGVFRYFVAREARALELLAVDEAGASTRLALDLGDRAALASGESTVVGNDADTGASGGTTADGGGPGPVPSADVLAAERDATGAADPSGIVTRSAGGSLDGAALRDIDFGVYYALIIGNNDYQSMSDLNTAADDARAVESVLRERYGFQTELLVNATRHDMLAALNRLRETLTPDDNLIVYYAGHGELDDVSRRGYWLPVDATADDTRNWIANSVITDQIDAMDAKHVMVIADSCYSGTLTRSSVARQLPDMSSALKERWYSAMAASKVRTVLSSGGVRPVLDGAPGAAHSIFAQAFLDELGANGGLLEAYSLFVAVQRKVAETARELQVEQRPQYSPIRHSGHEAGEFVFVARPLTG